ncbi:ABC transporter substrate-binding protein [Bizionia argentinensis JUB59]|uniref:ABC transporter substrate-binding protein n=1 Tax=Bizionia argentinensis JUB59 TaxID=1046627 RepID=G2EC22_9FLAO|nr:ABC transporter substrate-binding protein [Bizionia argentinensis]EGV43955.1 ABC transporter substrate-binding protein [Bizionia argentinensis JUB59]
MLHKKIILVTLLVSLFFWNCQDKKQKEITVNESIETSINIDYATGFSIENYEQYTILNISNPWPNSEKNYSYLLLTKEQSAVSTFNKDDYDGIITIPIEKMVVTSTTHIPALELLEVENTLIGFPGTDYISSERTRKLIDSKAVRELGKNEGINTEVLLELNPNVVVGFGMDGTNKSLETISKSGIPVIYNGDWVETSPLAKAEWIKFFGVLYNKSEQADTVFRKIESDYLEAKKLAQNATNIPRVLSGAMHKDIWYLPSGTSPEAQLLKDANVNYLWQNTDSKGSLALNFEAVYEKAKDADIWISPSYYGSYEALEKANAHYTQFDAFKNKTIYSFVNTAGETGGVTYYEIGTARPDLVLKDLVKIAHPELLEDYESQFFHPLQ